MELQTLIRHHPLADIPDITLDAVRNRFLTTMDTHHATAATLQERVAAGQIHLDDLLMESRKLRDDLRAFLKMHIRTDKPWTTPSVEDINFVARDMVKDADQGVILEISLLRLLKEALPFSENSADWQKLCTQKALDCLKAAHQVFRFSDQMNEAVLKGVDWPKTKRDKMIADVDHLLSRKPSDAALQGRFGIGAGYTYQVLVLTAHDNDEQAFLQGLGLRWVTQFPQFEPLFARLLSPSAPKHPLLPKELVG